MKKIIIVSTIILLTLLSVLTVLDWRGYWNGLYTTYEQNKMIEEADKRTVVEDSDETKVVKTKNSSVSYEIANDSVYVATVHISNQAWKEMGDEEREKVVKKIAKNTVESGEYKTVIGITSGMKLLFTYEGDKDDYTIKTNQ